MTMIPSFGNRQNLFYIRRTEPEMGRVDDLWFNPDTESWSVYDGSAWVPLAPGAGDGDMTRVVYDPQNILGDAFDRANHTGTQAQSTVTDLEADQATQDGRLDALEAVPEGMEKTVYDPQNVAGDVFARANHTGAQAQSTVTGLEAGQATQDGRLDALEAAPGGGANLSIVNRNANTLTVASDSGDDAIVPEATPTLAGGLAAADKASINALQSAAFAPTTDFATAAQGALADSALQTGDVGDAAFKDVGTGAGDVAAGDAPAASVSGHDGDGAAHGGSLTKVKVSGTDTTADFLLAKLFSSDASVSFVLSGGGGNEQIDVKSTGGDGSSTFIGLTDTPNDYVGNAGKLVKVDPTGNFLIFGDPSGTSVSWGDIGGDINIQTDLMLQQDAQDTAIGNNTTHRTGALDGASGHVSAADRSDWDAAHAAEHSHSNKLVLDGITGAGDGTSLLTNDGNYKSEASLPISTATQTALDGKSDTGHNHDGDYDALGAAQDVQNNLDTHEAAASPHSGHLISVVAGTNIAVDNTDPQNPTISAAGGASGEANEGANVGLGSQVFKDKTSVTLNFRTLVDTATVEWTQGIDELYAAVPANTFEDFGAVSTHNADASAHGSLLPIQDQKDAMDEANGPTFENPFATMADVGGGVWTDGTPVGYAKDVTQKGGEGVYNVANGATLEITLTSSATVNFQVPAPDTGNSISFTVLLDSAGFIPTWQIDGVPVGFAVTMPTFLAANRYALSFYKSTTMVLITGVSEMEPV